MDKDKVVVVVGQKQSLGEHHLVVVVVDSIAGVDGDCCSYEGRIQVDRETFAAEKSIVVRESRHIVCLVGQFH